MNFSQITCDLHCDALFSVRNGASLAKKRRRGHFDLPRMIAGGVWCEVLSMFVHPRWIPKKLWWSRIEKFIGRLRQALDAAPDKWALATAPEQVFRNYESGLRSIVLEIEGLHPIERDPGKLELLWNAGVRIFTLTWNNSNIFATSAVDAEKGDNGLTHAGKEIVREISKLGGIIDLSHASDRTFAQVLDMGISPLLSHSCVREIKGSSRNATLDMIRWLGEARGIIGINFYPGFLSSKKHGKVTSNDVIGHIATAISAGGEHVVALGSDFDGVSALPADMPDVSAIGIIAQKMKQRGFSDIVISRIMGENFLEYWQRIVVSG